MLKKFAYLFIALASIQTVYADDLATKIKVNIKDGTTNHRHYVCMPNIGCLNIADAKNAFPIAHPVKMKEIVVMDISDNLRFSRQSLPNTCASTKANQTIVISGNFDVNKDVVKDLDCAIS